MGKIWKRLVLLGELCLLMAGAVCGRRAGGALPAANSVPMEDKAPVVAITFDDGPLHTTTTRLLDGLALREVPATFFLVGERISGNEALIRRMAAEGHQIGVHSYSHIRITGLSRVDFDGEVAKPRAQLAAILGEECFWLRPPYGITDQSVRQWAGSPIVLWSVDPEDWKDSDVGRIVGHILSRVQDGDIILFHDIYESSVDAALQTIDALQRQGYCFATAEQLLACKGVTPENGVCYTQVR